MLQKHLANLITKQVLLKALSMLKRLEKQWSEVDNALSKKPSRKIAFFSKALSYSSHQKLHTNY